MHGPGATAEAPRIARRRQARRYNYRLRRRPAPGTATGFPSRVSLRLLLAGSLLSVSAVAAAASTAVEYFHAGYGHYFVTAAPDEAARLDAGSPPGWQRTGETFAVRPLHETGHANVCRFWSGDSFAPKSSHFYTPFASECAPGTVGRAWRFEGEVFAMSLPDAAGGCAWGTEPLYRLYNDGRGGAPNHRYTTSAAIRDAMRAQGWVPEGVGSGVIGCVPKAAAGAFTVVAAGDIAQCAGAPAYLSAASRTATLVQPADALVLTLGDNAYDGGTAEEFANCFDPTWGAFKDRIRPAIGNHEHRTASGAPYFEYFGAQAGPPGRGYYSFDFGGWHFVALDSMIDTAPGSPQYEWLVADLAASRDALCTIAYWHYPVWSSGAVHGGYAKMLPMFDALHRAGVELLLTGDEHLYERFAPQDARGVVDPARGVRQFIVGTGGANLYEFGRTVPNSEYRYNVTHGVLRLTLGADGYAWAFVPVGGGPALDTGAARCHR
jgi:hypothetical protein